MSSPLIESIGIYTDVESGRKYEVIKRTFFVQSAPINGSRQVHEVGFDYITTCGIDLEPLKKDLSSFELIQIDGVIHKDA